MKNHKIRAYMKASLVVTFLVVLVVAALNLDFVLYVGANRSPQYISELCKDTLIKRAPHSDLALAFYIRMAAAEESHSMIGSIIDSYAGSDADAKRLLNVLETVDEGNFISVEMRLDFVFGVLRAGRANPFQKDTCVALNKWLVKTIAATLKNKRQFSKFDAGCIGVYLRLRNSIAEYVHSDFEDSRAYFEFKDSLGFIEHDRRFTALIKSSLDRMFVIASSADKKADQSQESATEQLALIIKKKGKVHRSLMFEGLLYQTVFTNNRVVATVKALDLDPLVVFNCRFCLLFLHQLKFLEKSEFRLQVYKVYEEIEVVIVQALIDRLETKTIEDREIYLLAQYIIFNDFGRRSIYQWFRDKVNRQISSPEINSVALGILLGECQRDSIVSDEQVIQAALRIVCQSEDLSAVKTSYNEFSRFTGRAYHIDPSTLIPANKKEFYAKILERLHDQWRRLKK